MELGIECLKCSKFGTCFNDKIKFVRFSKHQYLHLCICRFQVSYERNFTKDAQKHFLNAPCCNHKENNYKAF